MSRPPIDLRGCRFTLIARRRLPRRGFVRVHKCVEYPRLTRLTGRASLCDQIVTTWRVDDCPASDIQTAIRMLAGIPVQMELPL